MSQSAHLEEIPYYADSCELFERIRDLPRAVFLDSSFPHAASGRYDLLAANPSATNLPQLAAGAGEIACRSWFDELARFHQAHYQGIQPVSPDIPFCGGILGYLGYGLGESLHDINLGHAPSDSDSARAQLCAYDWGIVQDHLLQRSVLVCLPQVSTAERADLLSRLRSAATREESKLVITAPFSSNVTAGQYREAFERVQAYIHAGDCYQVNLSQCYSSGYLGDPWAAYRTLRRVAAAPFSAYLTLPDSQVLTCLSPERFLSLHGQRVETSPIKGTRPRYADRELDELARRELGTSAKDRAENLMIVDLLRNDLGRSCVTGSIHVDRLFELQSYPTVHHLVSTIGGDLQPDRGPWELLRDSFPGGSITGAPKRRAMEIIAELEPHSREAYCGSVLYISADGRMDSNIAIRSLLWSGKNVQCWGGGGIVADSAWQQEYQESWDKVGKLLGALEQDHRRWECESELQSTVTGLQKSPF
ncbi:MAG: aminodeoxychorismate synthase component I [Halieaceae bacterium]|nr:aminodeoxychorismate synthase component I [Halieaceae bacterium]MCP4840574.1 aminodeoxychorismate synthase component I [Halieaceae bacterium]